MKYDAITIGFGQGAHKIARDLAKKKWKVAMIEKNDQMYGGSCVNIGCIPTKLMDHDAKEGHPYEKVKERRDQVVAHNRENNYNGMQNNEYVDVYTGIGSFKSNHVVEVATKDGTYELEGTYIFIDTGSVPNMPPIDGLKEADHVYNSTTLQELDHLPATLGIIGGGNIGLEFASIYATLGAKVTLLERSDSFMEHEEPEIAEAVQKVLEDKGIRIQLNAESEQVSNSKEGVEVKTSDGQVYSFEALLVAAGHKPQTAELNLEATDIEVDEKGGIKVNEQLETTAEKVYAVGDVRGKLKFTYITTDDAALVLDHLLGNGTRKLSERKHVPYAIFIDPPVAHVGLTEKEANEKGYTFLTNIVPVKSTVRSNVINDERGLYKAVVNKENEEILGVSLFGDQAHELVNMMKMAMDNHIPYTYLRDQVITHPVMSEIFNTLFDLS
ncbi:FAD-dependent oxidoreductase [Pisciglobus halotolerans]|uniref:Pyruvate/2-oxoglutarate dehydrogenase complex, dihydrolipoamide dehydrogenase (E3) component n=1 Tax=Pisciglobus halotolerans TaxID=745365 RepID=A0A1I3APB0_9LACT|nr:FAD-dependent oxidoreductase [Pisciglobus halotolerans]SFH51905.1 Pyruvate/2-oxoglutarate dehydrogenase complex, dihydrolipoamide dehydrogenase (E3) component [Pisciglobus halotolerans]